MGQKSNSNLLAGLCYVPFLLINIIFIVYVLVKEKDDRYARYHALQSLCLNAIYLVVGMVVMVLFFAQFFNSMMAYQQQMLGASSPAATSQAFRSYLSVFLPIWAVGMVVVILFLVMAVLVALGKDVRLPILRGFVERFV